jgi:hypothetical protein
MDLLELAGMYGPTIADILKKMIQNGTDSPETQREISALRDVLRERVRRDMRFNTELLDEQKLYISNRILNLECNALEFAFGQSIPVKILFNTPVSEEVLSRGAGGSALHRARMLDLDNEAKLMERTLHRIRVARIRAQFDLPIGDIAYLRKLMKTLEIALR